MEVSQKIKIELPYGPAIPLWGIYLEKNKKALLWKSACPSMVIEALCTIAKIWKEPKCSLIDERIKKMWHIYNGILFSHKKEENLAICNNMDGPWGHYTKWSKSDRERQLPYDLTYMWNLKTKNKKPPS